MDRTIYRITKWAFIGFASLSITVVAKIAVTVHANMTFNAQRTHNARLVSLGEEMYSDRGLAGSWHLSCAQCHSGPSVAPAADFELVARQPQLPQSESMPGPSLGYLRGALLRHSAAHDEQSTLHGREQRDAIASAKYAGRFDAVFGQDTLGDVDATFVAFNTALAAYEASSEFNRFDSKFDLALVGVTALSDREERGYRLFVNPSKGNCAACHTAERSQAQPAPLFTNLSISQVIYPDSSSQPIKVPTLRNVATRRFFFHTQQIQDLRQAVVLSLLNPADPLRIARETDAFAREGSLTAGELDDLVAFLQTLNDGYAPPSVMTASNVPPKSLP